MWELFGEIVEILFSKEAIEATAKGAAEFASTVGSYNIGNCNINSNIDCYNVNHHPNYQNFKDNKKNIKSSHNNNQTVYYKHNSSNYAYTGQSTATKQQTTKNIKQERTTSKQQYYNAPAGSVAFVFPQPTAIRIGNQIIQIEAGGKLIVPPGNTIILPSNYVVTQTNNAQLGQSANQATRPQVAKENKAEMLGNQVREQYNLSQHTTVSGSNKNSIGSPINKNRIKDNVNQK